MANKLSPPTAQSPIERLKELLLTKGKLCLVGDGLSAECGAPHFYDILTGVWSIPPSPSKINPFNCEKHYALVHEWFEWRKAILNRIKSLDTFEALKALQGTLDLTVATQSIDGLVRRCGISDVIELYGNIFMAKCHTFGHTFPSWPNPPRMNESVVRCDHCDEALFPDVQMFGWNVKTLAREQLDDKITRAQFLISLGTNVTLTPFATNFTERRGRAPTLDVQSDAVTLIDGKDSYKFAVAEFVKALCGKAMLPEQPPYEHVLKALLELSTAPAY